MSILLFLILASLGLALSALLGFIWAVKTGQFEDTCTPSMRLLIDEADAIGDKEANVPRPAIEKQTEV